MQESLRKIQIFTSILLKIEDENLSIEGKSIFKRVQLSTNKIRHLIRDSLSYLQINKNDQKHETINLKTIIDKIKIELHDRIKEKNAIIETNQMCSVNVIVIQFQQLLYNLINNSLKFSQSNVHPIIIINSQITSGKTIYNKKILSKKKYCHISITDNGIGFEAKYNERIFEVFQRLNSKGNFSSTGIGLSIVKKIVDNHNGIIKVKSKLMKGSTFDIYIPHI